MNRVVFQGGFLGGAHSLDQIAKALEPHFELIDTISFSRSFREPVLAERMRKGANLILTHSAGVLMVDTWTEKEPILAMCAPIPVPQLSLIGRALIKTTEQATHGDFSVIASCTSELLLHPVSNCKPFVDGWISSYNIAKIVKDRKELPMHVVAARDDKFFPVNDTMARFMEEDLPASRLSILSGVHDQIYRTPERTILEALESANL